MPQEPLTSLANQYNDLKQLYEKLQKKILLTNRAIRQTTKVINQLEYTSKALLTIVLENQTNVKIPDDETEKKNKLKSMIVDLNKTVANLRKVIGALDI
ncbi:hypothetical protein UR09_00295 [Candidatus Nitromaritima sp. SCGC AAA799-A02]|nr:hypothetical protein UR09_00295 [Candidatus Nitromaritima sp. SCGC AAA799-A02]